MELSSRIGFAGALALASLLHDPAAAQDEATVKLGRIDVYTRIQTGTKPGPASTNVTPPAPSPGSDAAVASNTGIGINGASTSVITSEEIMRAPEAALQDIIARQPGVQTWSTFGAVNGAGTTIDVRGFGASATSNTLVLLNGRRLTDIDIAGVDFSAIPRESIERIEITRGNAGAVLYGDGAVGGTINIVAKTGENVPPYARISGGFGTFNQREGNVSAGGSFGSFAATVFGNAFDSDGYRQNNKLRQRDASADLRAQVGGGTAYLYVTADDQQLGLPGARRVTLTSSELVTDPTGATTPTAFANKQGVNVILGYSRLLTNGIELIVDGSIRQKDQQAFSEIAGFAITDNRRLTTYSATPRLVGQGFVFGMPTKVITGFDYYDATLGDNRGAGLNDPPVHRFNLQQRTAALYYQQTIGITPNTDISFGARGQQMWLSARDRFDAAASGAFFDAAAMPLDTTDVQWAAHVGAEHRFNRNVAVFGRLGRSFRTPNVDERIGVLSFPVDFRLRTQTSQDAEAGVRLSLGPVDIQSSVYDMRLQDEIHFSPAVFANINLDPTRRYGSETSVAWRVNDRLLVKGGVAYTRAVFREGPNAGNDVPLVSRFTATGSVSWNVWEKILVADAIVRYVGERRMDNDQANFQPLIPPHTLVDLRLGGEYRNLFYSLAVQNLFDVFYFDYAVASAFTFGTYNAYPQPGRVIMGRLGLKLP
jgi:iron complex outermembrane recepter protein